MATALRKTGLGVVGDMPWGTHLCLFYETKADLLDTVIPYVKAGLESQELCVWMVAEPLTEEEARHALRQALPALDRYLADRSIEFLLSREWYLQGGTLDLKSATRGWQERLGHALARGYAGMRVAGDASWLKKQDWSEFCTYENKLNASITQQRVTVLCAYPLATSGAADILDVVRTHQFAIAKRHGTWEAIETSELRHAQAEIEQRVVTRTRQLTAVNEELRREILERKRAEVALRKSEERWRAVFENSAVGIALTDLSGRFLAANVAYQNMLGYSEAELRALSFIDITHEDDREGNWKLAAELRQEQRQYYAIEKRYRRKDGHLIWANVHVSLVPGTESIPRFFMGIVEDITERKRAEEHLARLNRTLQTLYQGNQALVHATEEYELLQSVCQILVEVGGLRMAWVGYRELNAEQTVRPVAQAGYEEGYLERIHVTWADTERGQGPTGTAIRTGKACWTNNVQTDPKFALWRARALERGYASTIALPMMSDGEPFGALSLYAEEPDAFNEHTLEQFTELANNLAYGVMALRTREDRKRAEEALRESERQFRALFDEAAIGMALVNAVGHSLESNRKLQQMLGYSADELRQMPFTKVTHPDDVPPDWNLFMELVSGRRDQYQIDKRYYRKDGRLVWGSLTMSLVRDERGEPMFAIAMVEDITERKRAEEALRQTQAALAHLSRVMTMGELTASIAHEVNQPLAGVITNGNACLRWLAREAPDLEEARAAVERIIRDGNRASEVIRRIRALAKKTDPQTAWLDVNDVIHEVGALVQSEVRKHRVLLRMALSTALPPLLGDRVQLQQVVLNLIINGIEAMSSVADRPRELLIQSGTQGSSGIFVAVRDSGIGLDPQHLARLFDAFFTTKPGGMGMGLSISRTIIEAHGGQLWATPNEGHGATFRFTLPTGGERVS